MAETVQPKYVSLPKDEYDTKGFPTEMKRILELGMERFSSESRGQDPVAAYINLQALEGIVITCGKDGIPEIHASLPAAKGSTPRYKTGARVDAYTRSGGKASKSVNLNSESGPVETFDVIKPFVDVTSDAMRAAKNDGKKKQRKQELGEGKYFPWTHKAGAQGELYTEMEDDLTAITLDKKIGLISEMRRAAREKLKDSLGGMDSQYIELKELKILAGMSKDDSGATFTTNAVSKDLYSRMAIMVKTKDGYEGFASVGFANVGTEGMVYRRLDGKVVSDPFDVARSVGEDAAFVAKAMEDSQDTAFAGGKIPVIMGGKPASVWIHEGNGHPKEADIISDNSQNSNAGFKLKTTIGSPIGPKNFNVIEDARARGGKDVGNWGSIHVDDEGTTPTEVKLVNQGMLERVMTSREYVSEMAAPPTADGVGKTIRDGGPTCNKRSEDFSVEPLVRMTNTMGLADPNGATSVEKMASMIPPTKKGLYMMTSAGGQVDPDGGMFMVNGGLSYLVENSTITPKVVRGAAAKDNLKNVPEAIKAIGSAETVDSFYGMCGKDGQWVRVEGNSPSILMEVEVSAGGWGKRMSEKQDEEIKKTRKDLREGTLDASGKHFDVEFIGSKTLLDLITEPAKQPDYVFDGKNLIRMEE